MCDLQVAVLSIATCSSPTLKKSDCVSNRCTTSGALATTHAFIRRRVARVYFAVVDNTVIYVANTVAELTSTLCAFRFKPAYLFRLGPPLLTEITTSHPL